MQNSGSPKPVQCQENQEMKQSKVNSDRQSSSYLTNSNTNSFFSCSEVLLPTALIYITDKQDRIHECRAMLDSCSQANYITSSLCKKLNLPLQNINMSISCINQSQSYCYYKTSVSIGSKINSFAASINCLVVPTISSHVPRMSFNADSIRIPNGIKLADPEFNISQKIDLLIGAEMFWKVLDVGRINLEEDGALSLQETEFGWIVIGVNCPQVQLKSTV